MVTYKLHLIRHGVTAANLEGRYAGRTPEIKKAYVTLKEDSKTIEFFDGMAQ